MDIYINNFESKTLIQILQEYKGSVNDIINWLDKYMKFSLYYENYDEYFESRDPSKRGGRIRNFDFQHICVATSAFIIGKFAEDNQDPLKIKLKTTADIKKLAPYANENYVWELLYEGYQSHGVALLPVERDGEEKMIVIESLGKFIADHYEEITLADFYSSLYKLFLCDSMPLFHYTNIDEPKCSRQQRNLTPISIPKDMRISINIHQRRRIPLPFDKYGNESKSDVQKFKQLFIDHIETEDYTPDLEGFVLDPRFPTLLEHLEIYKTSDFARL